MNLDSAIKPPTDLGAGRRFFLVSYLPTYAATMSLLLLVWAGARGWTGSPRRSLDFTAAWTTAAHLGAGELVVLVLTITVVAILIQPLQLSLIRMLEGNWPRLLGSGLVRKRQQSRKNAWADTAKLPQGDPAALTAEVIQQAGKAGHELRRRFPLPDHLLRATALGNALAAMEDSAGRPFGLDAVAAWPRLYPVISEQLRALLDDRRDSMDAAARMSATMSVTALASAVLLSRSGWWLALALIPLVVSRISYRGAVQAAMAYGESVHAAFDLHRFDLLTALHLEPPASQVDERSINSQLCDLWRQGVPIDPAVRYVVEGKTK